MPDRQSDLRLVQYTAKQQASSLLQALATALGVSSTEVATWRVPLERLHFHDSSASEIAWNDVQAIQMMNALLGYNIPVPDQASEGFNKHYHTSDYDGGFLPGTGPHDHRDNANGGFAFAIYHPGTAVPQQVWPI